ncbi:MAG: RNA methyltransferase [Lachnospiraceae bacterium]|nr:RNA methyltransferase [Lachnospiraceae bacterium]
MVNITSASNDKIKNIKKLLKSSKERNEQGVFIVEGIRMFKEIPKESINSIFVSENFYDKNKELVDSFGLEAYVVSDNIFGGISDTGTPQGVLALVNMFSYDIDEVICGIDTENDKSPFVIIAERLQDPGNLGTIIRTSEGAGATGIMLSKDSVDIYNPKVVRSTMGSIFRVPIYISEDLKSDIDYIKSKGVTIYGAHLEGRDFYEKNFANACGFLIGNEGNGLSEEISQTADDLIRIPMKGKVESLNAATSVAVISYEVLRQRL